MRKRLPLCGLLSLVALATVGTAGATPSLDSREGGIFRVVMPTLDYVDPALAYSFSWALLDTTCARLMTYPDKPAPEGLRLVPEVAAGFPKMSRNGKTHTFTLRTGFRFSDGTPVRASAFARAINRTLAPGVQSPGAQYTGDIVGAADVRSGKTDAAAGVSARGNPLTVRFARPVVNFPAMTSMPFFCAVPPTLPADPEGVGAFPSAGPYVVTEYRRGERVTIRRNRFYRGARPHHVDGFDVDLRSTSGDVLAQVERGEVDWGALVAPDYFEPGRNLAAKFGVNKSRFFVKPGLTLSHLTFNASRPLFRDNTRLRQAVNFALNRRELANVALTSRLAYRLTDQYLPPSLPGFRDARLYPLERPNLTRARALARGSLRGGKAIMWVIDGAQPVSIAQAIKQQLALVGLDIEVRPLPAPALFGRIGEPGEPWDLTLTLWVPDFIDPFQYSNILFDGQYAGGTNFGRFDSPALNAQMRRAARLQGDRRYQTYGELDVRLVRDAAPGAALNYLSEATLVSKRVGCVVLRPTLDLTAVCLK